MTLVPICPSCGQVTEITTGGEWCSICGPVFRGISSISASSTNVEMSRIAELEAEIDILRAACAEKDGALRDVLPFVSLPALSGAQAVDTALSAVSAARKALSSDGSGYAAVVEAAQPLRSVDPEIMFRGHAEDYVKAEMPVSIWHNFMQALDALDGKDT